MILVRPALLRVLAFLIGVTTVGFVYEHLQVREMEETKGEIVDTRFAAGNVEYTIRYEHDGRSHHVFTTLGVADMVGRYSDLAVGDTVSMAYDPSEPGDAKLATLSGLYVFTLCAGAITVICVAVILYRVVTGREG